MVRIKIFALFACSFFALVCTAQVNFQSPKDNPTELGKVNWLRSYDEALALSKERNLPVFLLFQEVPGCSNCTRFGNGAISDPFIVEAIESHFIPLAIFNNKKGEDARILAIYKEPSWNNPVVRIVNAKGENITKRLSADLSTTSVLNLVLEGLEKTSQETPAYLHLYSKELKAKADAKEVNLAMYCFWTGEKEIAKIDGVISTEAGFMDGREVVKVNYNEDEISLEELVSKADKAKCADVVYLQEDYDISNLKKTSNGKSVKKSSAFRADKEVKYYLSNSPYKFVPMIGIQQAKVNTALGEKKDPTAYLSPRQILLYKNLENLEKKDLRNTVNSNFESHWYALLNEIKA